MLPVGNIKSYCFRAIGEKLHIVDYIHNAPCVLDMLSLCYRDTLFKSTRLFVDMPVGAMFEVNFFC